MSENERSTQWILGTAQSGQKCDSSNQGRRSYKLYKFLDPEETDTCEPHNSWRESRIFGHSCFTEKYFQEKLL